MRKGAQRILAGNEEAGKNFAGLYAVVASCEKNGVNAIASRISLKEAVARLIWLNCVPKKRTSQ